jgi:hypothetical protein
MDRRRFVPSTEGLEDRALYATNIFGPPAATPTTSTAASTVPSTFKLKIHRIERLPFYLNKFGPGRFIPSDVMQPLQNDLTQIAAKLHPPGSTVLQVYNDGLRPILTHSSLSPADVTQLNNDFGTAVAAMGATPEQVANLQKDLENLAKFDTTLTDPVFFATNDYSTVLQTIIAVGRPIRRPDVPELAATQGTRINANVGVTSLRHPTFIGYYDAYGNVQIVDSSGKVYGEAAVAPYGPPVVNGIAQATGRYKLNIDVPLTDGLYTLYARAVDDFGNVSDLSAPFKLLVISPGERDEPGVVDTPAGPLALQRVGR